MEKKVLLTLKLVLNLSLHNKQFRIGLPKIPRQFVLAPLRFPSIIPNQNSTDGEFC